jgi:hypothetical protein
VVGTPHPADWYGTNGGPGNGTFANNVVADGSAGVEQSAGDLALYVVDARAPCGEFDTAYFVGGKSGILSARTLEGLVGSPDRPECPDQSPDRWGPCRWAGNIAWSIAGQAGVPIPDQCVDSGVPVSCDDVLTAFGFLRYPAARLLPSDVDALAVSDLFVPVDGLAANLPTCSCGFGPMQQATCRTTCSPASCDDGDPCTTDFCGTYGCNAARADGTDALTCAFRRVDDTVASCASDRTGGAILARVAAAGRRLATNGADQPRPRVLRRVARRLKRARRLRNAAARNGRLEASCDEHLRVLVEEALSQIRAWRRESR